MTSRQAPQVDLKTLLVGFQQASQRLDDVLTQVPHAPPADTFVPLFEALNWTVTISDFLPKADPVGTAPVMKGLRWIRNAVHHKWADALEIKALPIPGGGLRRMGGVTTFRPVSFDAWCWRPIATICQPNNDRGRAEYEKLLESRSAEDAILEARHLYMVLS